MKISENKFAGQIADLTRAVSTWRKNPGNKAYAAHAAVYYAKKFGKRMCVVPGNSYMQAVYHIAEENKSLVSLTGEGADVSGLVVYPDGKVYQATLSK